MSTPIVFPPIQSGIYQISTIFPEFYLELQRDSSLRATKLNRYSDAQKWNISPAEDGTYQIICVMGNHELPCETYYAHNPQAHHRTQLWTIDSRGVSFTIANAHDHRVLDLFLDNMVGFSDRDNVRGQRWVLHLIKSNDDTLALRTMMAAMQPYASPGASDIRVNKQSDVNPRPESYHSKNPQPNPARVRKTPITHGVVREGIYRIASAIRRNDTGGFLELQEDDTVKVAALNEASDGQKWEVTYYQNSKYYIKSSLNSHVLALRPSENDPNLMDAVAENGFPTPWTIEPRRDAYFIGVADDERVLDLAENDNVVFRNLSGDTTQRWDLDPVRFQHQPAFKEGMSYLIKNHATGRVIWLTNNRLTCFSHDDGDSALNFTFKNQPDGGTAVHSVRHELWVTAELDTSTTEHSYRFIPTETGGKFYYISTDMMSNPPKVMQDSGSDLALTILYENEKQMWELVPKLG